MHLTTLHDIKCIYVHNYISISTMNVTNHLYIPWIRGIYSYQCNISLCSCITMRIRISQTFDVGKYIFLRNEISNPIYPREVWRLYYSALHYENLRHLKPTTMHFRKYIFLPIDKFYLQWNLQILSQHNFTSESSMYNIDTIHVLLNKKDYC